MNLTARHKAIIFFALIFLYLILLIKESGVTFEKFSQGSILDNALAIIVIILLCSFASFLTLLFIDKFFLFLRKIRQSKVNTHKSKSNIKVEDLQKYINYWGGIISNNIKLTDGSMFDSHIIYNEKYLKYKKTDLELACITLARSSEDIKFIEDTKSCYMYFANFDNKVNDKVTLQVGKIVELVTNTKDQSELVKQLSSLNYEEGSARKETLALQEGYIHYINKFNHILKK